MNIFEEAKKLDLPIGEYVVFGSGILSAKGIRPAKDIDLLVTPTLFRKLLKEGWKRKYFYRRFFECKSIRNGIAEVFSNAYRGNYNKSVEDIISSAEVIEGIPFMNLNELKEFKIAMGRNKDLDDVKLIEAYLKKQKCS
jgi:hypothetical protein